ncbi:TrkH family potassium uptake protein [Archaeoglobus profundus]|uniref:Potassium uptake protein, TrkH family n=1 Tax=Archaeoglobus profundus (strain DSM 5631 / JCM 9629 / NBRC 100127 / Av18) TaxID=572546 RepID=D2RGJ9_ARCPA|nr:TrkH family potassium uptake protein [Archaeoglobus profundus]ADB57424.1 potassium uptake protein, TrkH family [Archaeoglobus profundus DSM 5631]
MNFGLVINTLGKISLAFFALMVGLTILAIYFNEDPVPFLTSSLFSLGLGILLTAKKAESDVLRFKEGFAIVGLGWLLVSFLGSIPFMYYIHPINAFFESISGFTTTGASVIDKPELLPRSILFWRSLTQWIGGIGIIMIFLLIIPNIATGAVFQAEYPGITLVKIKPRIRDTALRLYLIYVSLTVAEIVILKFLGVPIFDAVTHAFTTLSTGGYSTHSQSIAYFKDWRVEFSIAIFAILGGSNFSIFYFLCLRRFEVLRDREFIIYILLVTILTVTITLLNLDRYDLINSFRYSFFQVASIITTTGYTTTDFDKWGSGAKMLLLIAMFIGGCSGSTAGGMKVIRLYIMSKYAISQVVKSAEPKVVRIIKYGDRALRSDIVESVVAFFVLYIFIFTISSLIIALHGYDIVTSLSATAACLGNVGPGMGLAGASETYSHFPWTIKILLCLDMWIGRLEIYTVLALFIPSFWR